MLALLNATAMYCVWLLTVSCLCRPLDVMQCCSCGFRRRLVIICTNRFDVTTHHGLLRSVIPTARHDYFPKQHNKLVRVTDRFCSLRGTNRVLTYYLDTTRTSERLKVFLLFGRFKIKISLTNFRTSHRKIVDIRSEILNNTPALT
jgi:hypothetical protein